MSEKTLIELQPNTEGEIASIKGGNKLRSRLRSLGLTEGQKIKKLSKLRMGGPVIIDVHRAQVAIGRGMAGKILVKVEDDGPRT
jgi:ferrous iron transport protein A